MCPRTAFTMESYRYRVCMQFEAQPSASSRSTCAPTNSSVWLTLVKGGQQPTVHYNLSYAEVRTNICELAGLWTSDGSGQRCIGISRAVIVIMIAAQIVQRRKRL